MFFQEKNEASLTNYFFQKRKYTYSAEWVGQLTKPLGIASDSGIDVSDYDSLENNRHPHTGKPLTGKNNSGKQRNGSNFLIFPPLSMSHLIVPNLVWNQDVSKALMDLFLESVRQLLNFIEVEHAQARIRTENGRIIVKSKSLIFATFTHLFQSQMSPFIHVHVRLFQTTMVGDKFYTVRNELIKRSTKLYGLLLRANLMRELQDMGIETIVTDQKNGFFEIKGFEDISKVFSNRSDEIQKHIHDYTDKYLNLSKRFIKMISIRKNRKINNDESDVHAVLKSITKKLEEYGYTKNHFDIFRIIKIRKKRQLVQVETLLYLSYLQYGEKLFKYSKEGVLKIMAHHSIKLNWGAKIEDLLIPLNVDNFAKNIRNIIDIEIEKHNTRSNNEGTNASRPRVIINYAQGVVARARRVRESARIANRNADKNYQLIDDTNLWDLHERLLDLCDRESGVYRETLGAISCAETVDELLFEISNEIEIGGEASKKNL
jgi:conjugative relaxase-like TrwC/TraI family protein